MNAWRATVAATLAFGAFVAMPAAAQEKKGKSEDQCKLDFGHNDDVRSAYNIVTVLQISQRNPADTKKKLLDAMRDLTSRDDYGKDQLARDFVLGQVLVTWSQQPGIAPVAKRGDLGYQKDKDGTVDILAAADSAFTTVEKGAPDCADRTEQYRQVPWAKLINQVGPLLNDEKVDSADAMLKRSEVIYRGSPYTYYFEGQIAQKRKDWAGAAAGFEKAATMVTPEMAAKDSNVASVKEFSAFSAAYAALQNGQALTGDAQKAAMKQAAGLYQAYLKDYPSGSNVAPAQAGLSIALKASGDTASLGAMWEQMAAKPDAYTDAQLYDAGTQAFTAGNYKLAIQLMEQGQRKNPYLRAGLFNLANAYWKESDFAKMMPVAKQLVDMDPDNPDNYQLVAIAFQGLGKGVTDAKLKKAYSDSVGYYISKSDKVPLHVSFTRFQHSGSKWTLAGSVDNPDSTKAQSGVLRFHFLDKSGAVVATDSTNVSVPAKGSQPFEFTVDNAAIVGYRYDPLVVAKKQ